MVHFIKEFDMDLGVRKRTVQDRSIPAIPADADDLLTLKVFPAHTPPPCERMIAATGKHERIFDKRRKDNVRMRTAGQIDAKLRFSSSNTFQSLIGREIQNPKAIVRIFLVEALDDPR